MYVLHLWDIDHNSIGKQYREHNGLSHLNVWSIYYAPEGRGRI